MVGMFQVADTEVEVDDPCAVWNNGYENVGDARSADSLRVKKLDRGCGPLPGLAPGTAPPLPPPPPGAIGIASSNFLIGTDALILSWRY